MNVALFKRFNGYRPFLYNFTIDACRFFHNQKSNPVAQYFYSLYRDVSNINHSCPYNVRTWFKKLKNKKYIYFINIFFSMTSWWIKSPPKGLIPTWSRFCRFPKATIWLWWTGWPMTSTELCLNYIFHFLKLLIKNTQLLS